MTAEAYPLHWPPGRRRTKRPARSRFDTTMAVARDGLMWQLGQMAAKSITLSTNVELRRDGLPYANQREPEDPGVAVYFVHKGKSMCFSCDRWDRVRDNIRAIEKTIEAMRGIDRWGTGDMVSAAFSGFEALPPPGAVSPAASDVWWSVLGVEPSATEDEIRAAYKAKARKAGCASVELNAARDAALAGVSA